LLVPLAPLPADQLGEFAFEYFYLSAQNSGSRLSAQRCKA
jgi:hypothetical protein